MNPGTSTAHEADAAGLRVAIVQSTYHAWATDRLLQGAKERFKAMGGSEEALTVVHAPGAWELPVIARALATSDHFHAIVALGVVIRGETDHFDFILAGVAAGLTDISIIYGQPVGLGVLTCNDMKQVEARCGGDAGNKGAEAMEAAIRSATIIHTIQSSHGTGEN